MTLVLITTNTRHVTCLVSNNIFFPVTPPPITRTVTQVFPVKTVPEHLPSLFSGCKYGTKRLGDFF